MTDGWFSIEFAQSLKWLAFLSLLSIPGVAFPPQGRFRTVMTTVWVAGLAAGVLALSMLALALVSEQPAHVWRPLLAMGIALTCAFGSTLTPMRNSYREAELRQK